MMNGQTENAVVWGAAGFTGGELMRLIVCHPNLKLAGAISETYAGCAVSGIFPNLHTWTDLSFQNTASFDWEELNTGAWILFTALGHGEAMVVLPPIIDKIKNPNFKVVDLSGDFRLENPQVYRAVYGLEHKAVSFLHKFTYGLPELNRQKIKESRFVANPGCMATGAELAILPAAPLGPEILCIAIDSKTGSSGAGIKPKNTTHHPKRMNNFMAYKQLEHQHIPEITNGWIKAGGSPATLISFVPQMAPLVRGIFTTAHIFTANKHTREEVLGRYESYYKSAPFVRFVDGSPAIADVWGTNRVDISVTVDGKKTVICTAIDNLMKGASSQAIQNANIMNGFNETAGLLMPAPSPV